MLSSLTPHFAQAAAAAAPAAVEINDSWGPRQFISGILLFVLFVTIIVAAIKISAKSSDGNTNKAAKTAGVNLIAVGLVVLAFSVAAVGAFISGILTSTLS